MVSFCVNAKIFNISSKLYCSQTKIKQSTVFIPTKTNTRKFCYIQRHVYRSNSRVVCCVHTSNNVEATGNKVSSCFDNVASTLLLVWTGCKIVT